MNMNLNNKIAKYLNDIETGVITLTSSGHEPPAKIYAGNCYYEGSDGSKITVFNDCGEWDYIDSITFADGEIVNDNRILDFPYSPSPEVAWKAYGIPGYLKSKGPTDWLGWKPNN